MALGRFETSTLLKLFRAAIDLNGVVRLLTGSADPTSVAQDAPAGSVYLRTNGKAYLKQDAGSSTNWKEIVDISTSQTISGKKIDGGAASATSRIIVPKESKAVLDGHSREEAVLVYATDEQTLYIDNGTTLIPIGGGVGGINFLAADDRDAESSDNNFEGYDDSGAAAPVDGTGGSAAGALTFTRESATPLHGTYSFMLEKAIGNKQGFGYATPFVIPLGYQSKPCRISGVFSLISGTLDIGNLGIWVYDVDNGALITPESNLLQSGAGRLDIRFDATDSENYRLIFHVATDSTNTWQVYFDDLQVSPLYTSEILRDGNWVPHRDRTADLDIGSWKKYQDAAATSPVDGTGGAAGDISLSRTVSASEKLAGLGSFKFTKSTQNAQGMGVALDFLVPRGYYVKPKVHRIRFRYNATANFGYGAGTAASPSDVVVYVVDVTNGQVIQPDVFCLDGSGEYVSQFQPNYNSGSYRLCLHVAATHTLAWDFFFDDVQIAPETSSRAPAAVIMRASGNPASAASGAAIIFPTVDYDNTGSYNATTGGFTAPASDCYRIHGRIVSANAAVNLYAYVDGVQSIGLGRTDAGGELTYTGSVRVNAGQVITIRPDGTLDVDALSTLHIESVAAAGTLSHESSTRVIAGRVQKATQTPVGITTVDIVASDVTIDDVGGFSASADEYEVKVSGTYRIGLKASRGSGATTQFVNGFYRIDGGSDVALFQAVCQVANGVIGHGSDLVKLRAGQKVQWRINTDGGAATDICCTIQRMSGPAMITASERVAAQVTGDAASAASGGAIVFPTTTYDTHGAYNATTGEFTAPRSDLYRIHGALASGSGAVILEIYVDGVSRVRAGTSDSNGEATVSATVKVNAGQKITLRPNGAAFDPTSASVLNFESLGGI